MSVTLQRALSESLGEFCRRPVFGLSDRLRLTDYLATVLPGLLKLGQPCRTQATDSYHELTGKPSCWNNLGTTKRTQ